VYFSGTWRGYWEQTFWGRQPMHDLVLHFADGRVEGRGVDIIGRFTFAGTYDERGNVTLTKQYLGKHAVLYRGTYDGEGTIFGRWSIGTLWSGPFALTLSGHSVPADTPVIAITADSPRPRRDPD
jgi:hypothetical protein